MLGMAIEPSQAEPFWTSSLRSLTQRGLRGVKLMISDAHVGIKAAVAKVLKGTWQRRRVHFLRNALAHAGKGQRQIVLALINTVFAQERGWAWHIDEREAALSVFSKFHEGEQRVIRRCGYTKLRSSPSDKTV